MTIITDHVNNDTTTLSAMAMMMTTSFTHANIHSAESRWPHVLDVNVDRKTTREETRTSR